MGLRVGVWENVDANNLPSTGHENNTAQPKSDKWLTSTFNFSSFNLFTCCFVA